MNVIYLYLSQQFDCDVLKKRLDSWIDTEKMVAVMGDMNIDYLDQKHPLKDYLAGKNFVQLVKKPTHERGNLLDHVYVNPKLLITEPIVTQRSVYFSDHDVIVLQIPQEYMWTFFVKTSLVLLLTKDFRRDWQQLSDNERHV